MDDTGKDWDAVNSLLEGALSQPVGAREEFVRRHAPTRSLAERALELLAHDESNALTPTNVAGDLEAMLRETRESASLVGLTIGPFELTREIARGGMGQVFEARRTTGDFEQTVAIKLLPGHRLDEEARLRFAIERRILAGLQHPNIAQLIDGGTLDDGMPYIVMEYVDGVSIDRYCREHALSNRAIIEMILKVCSAVQLAHRNLVVHRDIKPGNVLVNASGTPKLLDFGIAKMLDAGEEDGAERTRTGVRLLTPAYASPEQILGQEITTAVDVYALGLLTYKLLTGCLPYRAEPTDTHSMEKEILSSSPELPSEALSRSDPDDGSSRPPDWRRQQARALKGDLDNILLMALRKEPERRYTNVAALADDLQRHLDKRPIEARGDSLTYRLGLLIKRHPVALPASALALLLALGATSVFTWMLAQERDQALAAEARATRTAEFTASLLGNTSSFEAGDRMVPVTELLDTARQRVEAELAEQPRVALPLRMALGEALFSWSQYEQAVEEARAALTLAEAGASAHEQAMALDLLARITHDIGDRDEALDLSRRSFELLRETENSDARAQTLLNMALMLNESGHRLDALPVFAETETAMRDLQGEAHPDLAWLFNNWGWGLHALGRYDEAMARYNTALALLDHPDASSFDRALTLSNQAGLFLDTGRPGVAADQWRESLQLLQATFGEDGHAGVARGHNLLAIALTEIGHLDEAVAQSSQSATLIERMMGSDHRWLAQTLSTRAGLWIELDDLIKAEADIDRAARILEGHSGTDDEDYGGILLLRGRLALERGNLSVAEGELRRARQLIKPVAAIERTPIDALEWLLARVLALQGRAEGAELARSVVARMTQRLESSDWRLRLKRAALLLPPFNPAPSPEQIAESRALVAELAEAHGARAPRLQALSKALAGRP